MQTNNCSYKRQRINTLIDGKYGECAGHNIDEIAVKILKIISSDYNFENRLMFSRENQVSSIMNLIEEVAARVPIM